MAEGKSSKEVRTLLKKAKLSVDKTDYVTAVEQLDSVLLLEPDNCNGLLLKAFVLMKQGDCLEAEKVLWNVVRLQEGLVSGWQGLKELYEREGGTETRKDKVTPPEYISSCLEIGKSYQYFFNWRMPKVFEVF